jgi:SGNH hydrolase-like domain, acetyltransferase AlgX
MRSRFLFVAIFFGMTALPLAVMLAPMSVVEPVPENRRLAPPPSWSWSGLSDARLIRESSTWFDDHFGLRSLLIRAKTQIDYSVFDTSSRVHLGKDGQLFPRGAIDLEKPLVDQYLRAHEADVLNSFRALAGALNARGIRLMVIINLMSDRYLADKLPATIPHFPEPRAIDGFLAKLAATPGLTYIDADAILRREQAQGPIFHKTDFHWNDAGAFGVAREVIDVMSRSEARPSPWVRPPRFTTRPFSGGLATFMPLFFPPSEEGVFAEAPPRVSPELRDSFWQAHVTNSGPDLLPPLFVFGDSFADQLERAGLPAYVRDYHRVWKPGDASTVSAVAAVIPPETRYAVFQFIEVSYWSFVRLADKKDVALAVERIRSSARPPRSDLVNGGMEIDDDGDRVPDGWQVVSARGTDHRVCNPAKAHTGNCFFRFKGDASEEVHDLTQVITHSGVAGNTLDLRLFVRANGITTGQGKIVLTVENTSGGHLETVHQAIPEGTYKYQELSLVHRVGSLNTGVREYDRIVVKITAVGMTAGSSLLVDDVSLSFTPP